MLTGLLGLSTLSCQTVWEKNGFTRTEARDWESRQVDPKLAKVWKEHGFKASEASDWKRSFDPSEARSWKKSGFNSADAQRWRSTMQPAEAGLWRDAGFTAKEAQAAADWKAQGIFQNEARIFRKNGFSLAEAKEWKANGFNNEEALAWQKIGVSPTEAKEWNKFGFSDASFDLKNHGFANHQEGISELIRHKILINPPTREKGEGLLIVRGIRNVLKISASNYNQWISNNFKLSEIISFLPWYELGFKIEEIKTWATTGIEKSIALKYLKANIPANTAKEWNDSGYSPEVSEEILEWSKAELSASQFKAWSPLKIKTDRVKEFISKNITPEVALTIIKMEKNYFSKSFIDPENNPEEEKVTELIYDTERVKFLSNKSILGDVLFKYVFAQINNDRVVFATTIPEISSEIENAKTDYKISKVKELIEKDQRISNRMTEFKEFLDLLQLNRLCHSSPFETKYIDNKWYIFLTEEFYPSLYSNVTKEFRLNKAWSVGNRFISPQILSVSNYPKQTCFSYGQDDRFLRCSIELSLKSEFYDKLDDDKLKTYWCIGLPLKQLNVQIKNNNKDAFTNLFFNGKDVTLVIADEDGNVVHEQ